MRGPLRRRTVALVLVATVVPSLMGLAAAANAELAPRRARLTAADAAADTSTMWAERAAISAVRARQDERAWRLAVDHARRRVLWLAPPRSVAHFRGVDWLAIARCESGGRWHIATGNGFFGGLQFTEPTWLGAGGGRFAKRADLAFPADQIRVASRLGLSSWPVCGANG